MKKPSTLETLILRQLRLTDYYAFDCNYLLSKVKTYTECPKDIRHHNINTACMSLRNRGYIYQANYDYYAITKEGMEYMSENHPLFEVIDLPKEQTNEKQ